MKKQLFVGAIALFVSLSFANAQGIGIFGGVNFQNLNGKGAGGNKLDNQIIPGFHAGISAQLPLVPEFFIQPGLLFSTKGGKDEGIFVPTTYRLSYIELPLNLVYKGQLGNGFVMVGFGPYIAYAVGGKVAIETGGATTKADIEFQNTVEASDPLAVVYFRALDAGGNIFAGYEMANGVFFQLNTQLGMLKINPEDRRFPENEGFIKNTGFGLSLGFRF
ncbi:MAG: outer membrane beta-barrel protein [Saprospiraceae bacterium]